MSGKDINFDGEKIKKSNLILTIHDIDVSKIK